MIILYIHINIVFFREANTYKHILYKMYVYANKPSLKDRLARPSTKLSLPHLERKPAWSKPGSTSSWTEKTPAEICKSIYLEYTFKIHDMIFE